MTDSEWREGLKSGDEVFVSQRYGGAPVPAKVTRVTPTQIVIDIWKDAKFKRSTGRLIGGSTWDSRYLIQPTDKNRERAQIAFLKAKARRIVDKMKFPEDRGTLEAMIAALAPFSSTE